MSLRSWILSTFIHKLRRISVTTQTYLTERQSSPIGYKSRISVTFKYSTKSFKTVGLFLDFRRQKVV